MNNCSDHPNTPITFICIAQHNCQRKLCINCTFEHDVKPNQLLPLQNFQEQINLKFQDLLVQYNQQLITIDIEINPLMTQIESETNKIKEYLKEYLQNTQDMIESEEKIFSNLMISIGNSQKISKREINQIVENLQGKHLEIQINKKLAFISQLQFIKNFLNKQIKRFNEILKEDIINLQINSKIEKEKINKKQVKNIQEYEGVIFDQRYMKFNQAQYKISQLNNQFEYMTSDGQILRIEQINNASNKPQVFMNIEQIKHLQWQGCYGDQSQKIGKWTASWKDQILNDVGGLYSNDGKKIGLWKELFQNYCSQAQAFKLGEYIDNRKCGDWMYIYKDINIFQFSGGGYYNNLGQKSGCWKTLSKNFQDLSQVFYQGQYQNGQKIGKWDIIWKIPQGINVFEQIGGGSFNENNMKNGIWIELCDNFLDYNQSIFSGQYQNGNKVGRWVSSWRNYYEINEFEQIGGGLYDDQSTKIGTWIEMSDNFNIENQVIYNGEYKNGSKVGKWNIQWRLNKYYPFLIIGGGYYSVNNLKIGKWIELSKNYENGNQCTSHCEYRDGKYFGILDILWREYIDTSFYQIGGGVFDLQYNKNGRWIEISDIFKYDNQVIYSGQYKNGRKVGRWDEMRRHYEHINGGFVKMYKQIYQIILIILAEKTFFIIITENENNIKIYRFNKFNLKIHKYLSKFIKFLTLKQLILIPFLSYFIMEKCEF